MNEHKPYDPRYLHLIFSALLMIQLVLTSVVLYVASDSASIFLLPLREYLRHSRNRLCASTFRQVRMEQWYG